MKDGLAFSKTIPAKFQTYLYFKKPIISLSSGVVSDYVDKYRLGISIRSNTKKSLDAYRIFFNSKNSYNSAIDNINKLYLQKYELRVNVLGLCELFYKVIRK